MSVPVNCGLATKGVGSASASLRAADGSFDILSTFRPNQGSGKLFREITLKEGTILERAFEEGKTLPESVFLTRGRTARIINSSQEAVDVLSLGSTSKANPNGIARFRLTEEIKARIGYINRSSDPRAIQILISNQDLDYLERIGVRFLRERR